MRWMPGLLVVAAITCCPAAFAEQLSQDEAEKLRKEMQDLRQEMVKLRTVMERMAETKADPRAKAAELEKNCQRMDALRTEAQKGGKDSAGWKELAAFLKHPDESTRLYAIESAGRLPAEVSGEALTANVQDASFRLACVAVTIFQRWRDARAMETALPRAQGIQFSGHAPDTRHRQQYVLETARYLLALQDARGVDLYMRQLAAELDERARQQATKVISIMSVLMAKDVLEQMNQRLGAGLAFAWGRVFSDEFNISNARKLLGWWEQHRRDFKLGPAPLESKTPAKADGEF